MSIQRGQRHRHQVVEEITFCYFFKVISIITYFNNLKNLKRKPSHLLKNFPILISRLFLGPGIVQVLKKKENSPKQCSKVHCKCLEAERRQFCDTYLKQLEISNALKNLVSPSIQQTFIQFLLCSRHCVRYCS